MAYVEGRKKNGRRLLLNPELIRELCSFIENGGSNKDAALLCNVDESTLYDWVNKG